MDDEDDNDDEGNPIELKPYTLKELAAIYGLTSKSFKGFIKDIEDEVGPRIGRYYTVVQVRVVFARKGIPGRL